MRKPRAGAVYNVCDDAPATSVEVAGHCAKLLGLPVPEPMDLGRANLSPMARSFYLESKRVSNQLVKRELELTLRFPTYKAGFATLLNANVCGQ